MVGIKIVVGRYMKKNVEGNKPFILNTQVKDGLNTGVDPVIRLKFVSKKHD